MPTRWPPGGDGYQVQGKPKYLGGVYSQPQLPFFNVYWNQVMAASLVVSLPIVVAFLLLQKYLVAGLTSGSVK